jgi:hypothetical protein
MANPELKRRLVLEVAGLAKWLVSEGLVDSTRIVNVVSG